MLHFGNMTKDGIEVPWTGPTVTQSRAMAMLSDGGTTPDFAATAQSALALLGHL
jgi:hypothetical protein